jgi:hypothetical protein
MQGGPWTIYKWVCSNRVFRIRKQEDNKKYGGTATTILGQFQCSLEISTSMVHNLGDFGGLLHQFHVKHERKQT